MKRRKTSFLIFVFLAILAAITFIWSECKTSKLTAPTTSLRISSPDRLPIARYWTSPFIWPHQVAYLAKTDILIVDVENMFNNYHSLVEIKRLNPDIKLLCYSNPMEIWTTIYNSRPWQNQIINEITNNRSQWLLTTIKDGQVNYSVFWTGMVMLNMSDHCPKIDGETYSTWMAKKLNAEILSDTIWDGYFMDNGTPNISWVAPNTMDINYDGQANSDQAVDDSWNKGVTDFLKIIRRKNKDFIIITNKGDLSFLFNFRRRPLVDGKMFENFPNNWLGDKWADGWKQSMDNAKHTGNYTIFLVNRRDLMFGITSALLLDNVYLAVGQDDAGYFPELTHNLGKPLGEYYASEDNKVYYREFERGQIIVTPEERDGKIVYY